VVKKVTDEGSLHVLLRDFLQSLHQLWQGVKFDIHGIDDVCYGMLVAVVADTPAANLLGGFKEGVAFAEKPCRACDVRRCSMSEIVTVSDGVLRDEMEHRDRVNQLSELSKPSYQYWSKEYGINRGSVLMEVPGFEITRCLLQDPMHVLLEGVLKYEFQCMLRVLVRKYKGLLAKLNSRLDNFEYTHHELADRPQVIDVKQLEVNATLAQTAAEMKTLVSILPFLLENIVDEDNEYWLNYLRLIHITHLCLSPVVSSSTIVTLRHLIAVHNQTFVQLYPDDSYTPKMHFMLHFPRQMEDFGPLRAHWCMRFEAKNGFFKSKKWHNFKNICLSLSLFHQRWMCLQMSDSCGQGSSVFLYGGDQVGAGLRVSPDQVPLFSKLVEHFAHSSDYAMPATIFMPSTIVVFGHCYEAGTVLLKHWGAGELPEFVRIDSVAVLHEKKFLLCTKLIIKQYVTALGGFITKLSKEQCVLNVDLLAHRWPQISHRYNGHIGIILQGVGDKFML
jgi:hypothetical protein